MDYPVEHFTDAERARLGAALHGSRRARLRAREPAGDGKGALFARYSRYPGTLRRLFLDEFADSLPEPAAGRTTATRASARRSSTSAIFVGYGDDSVAQLGGAHVACEWVSNVLTKILQRPRLGAYLEQSTRYIAYDAPMPGGGYRYYRDPELGPRVRAGDGRAVRRSTPHALPRVRAWVGRDIPARRGRVGRRAHAARSRRRRSTCCAACCRPPRSRTWGSSRPARPTSS